MRKILLCACFLATPVVAAEAPSDPNLLSASQEIMDCVGAKVSYRAQVIQLQQQLQASQAEFDKYKLAHPAETPK